MGHGFVQTHNTKKKYSEDSIGGGALKLNSHNF